MLVICVLRACHRCRRARPTAPKPPTHRPSNRGRDLQGIDAPAQFNITEHEAVPMRTPCGPAGPAPGPAHRVAARSLQPAGASAPPVGQLPPGRWRDTAGSSERQDFLGFVSFLSGPGATPLPACAVAPPLVMAVEELQHRDLLDFLWRLVRYHEQEVIIVPTLLVLASAVTMLVICVLRACHRCRRARPTAPKPPTHRPSNRGRDLQGIDAAPPAGQRRQLAEGSVLPRGGRGRGRGRLDHMESHWYCLMLRDVELGRRCSRGDTGCCVLRSSTAITRGGATETTPTSTGRKGCGPRPDRKETKPRKSCLSLLPAVSKGTAAPPAGQRRQLAEGSVLPRGGRGRGRGRLDHMESHWYCLMLRDVELGRRCTQITSMVTAEAKTNSDGTQPVSPRELEDTEMRKWQAPEVLAGRDITQSSDT
ncbi:hypothetical protein CRUP_025584 [Coryphaenoides rupestris]|nr:hypothetical protein CRUP_025584 [Coryphaenoides rupestris]